jgi:hypothetical protein
LNEHLSSLRAQLLKAQQLLPGLLVDCFERAPILPGTIYTLRRKCGKSSCHCGRGQLHDSTVLSYRGSGRPQNITPAAEHLETLRNLTEHYRRCRKARAQLVRWQKQLLKLVDALEAARVQLGEAAFRRLPKPPARKPRSSRS